MTFLDWDSCLNYTFREVLSYPTICALVPLSILCHFTPWTHFINVSKWNKNLCSFCNCYDIFWLPYLEFFNLWCSLSLSRCMMLFNEHLAGLCYLLLCYSTGLDHTWCILDVKDFVIGHWSHFISLQSDCGASRHPHSLSSDKSVPMTTYRP